MFVRNGNTQDIDTIMAMERSSAEAPHWDSRAYRKIFESQDGAIRRSLFVWETPQGLLGFAVAMVLDVAGKCSGELENLVVRHDVRQQGIGQALCEAVVSWCRGQAAEEVSLEVRASSAGAIRLYERLDFQKIGKRRAYYREPLEDAVLMRRLFR